MSFLVFMRRLIFPALSGLIAIATPVFSQENQALIRAGQQGLLGVPDAPHWGNGIDCSSCHVSHQSSDVQLTNLAGNANLCMSCHNPAGIASSKPFSDADRAIPGVSGTSHAWDVPAVSSEHGADFPNDSEMQRRVYDGNIVCSTCHNQHSQGFQPFLRASNYRNHLCKDCHRIRDVGSYRGNPNNKGSHPVGISYPGSDSRFFSSPQNPNLPLVGPNRVECTTCHSPHYADSGGANSGAGDGYILRVANNDNLCKSCHTYGEHNGMSCLKCHATHDPQRSNIFMVRSNIGTPNSGNRQVVFTSETGTNSFADGDSNYNGVCEVCHTQTAHHRNNSSGDHNHNKGQNCTSCHTHEAEFSIDCTNCHSQPQGNRRQIVGSGADFERQSHHVNGSPQSSDCTACHYLNDHQAGLVKLKNADNEAQVYVIDPDPFTSYTKASKMEPFCLSCHDNNGANGGPPFADGMMPPEIDAALWNTSSHKNGNASGLITCGGDGESFGCHANGHGSDKKKLLAPPDASQPPVAGDPLRQEEGMCYSCHDADGPASSNIESQFSLPSRHKISSNDQTDGTRLECSNCHNPHFASSSNLLADPDAGSKIPWSSDKMSFCLTCHDGQAPAGVGFPPGSSGTGYNKSLFVGTTHEINLGSDSCQQCHEKHGSAYKSLLKGEYITSDYNKYASADYQACWNCHDENKIIMQRNAFGGLHKEHVRGEDVPCIICHDTHRPYDLGEPGLINFNFAIQNGYDIQFINGRNASTAFWFDQQKNEGYCYLRCHGENHTPKKYRRSHMNTTR